MICEVHMYPYTFTYLVYKVLGHVRVMSDLTCSNRKVSFFKKFRSLLLFCNMFFLYGAVLFDSL